MNTIRVLVVDDHDLFRRGLAEVLDEQAGIQVVGEASDGKEAVEKALATSPDVVFMDLNMPGQGGIEATAYIRQRWPEIKVLVLTVSEEPADLFKALSVGALGYVLKTANPREIVEALHQVHQGWVVVSPSMAPRFISELGRPSHTAPMAESANSEEIDAQLTLREQEILQLVARDMSNAEIAGDLVVSENTVKTHVKNILSKLHSKNRSEAVAYASRLGFLHPH
ncbi:MAG: response regulator transcription factor [SAR202 cluster bacterium]|nr:response regulator transcription factor [SAR202 cluster bacterium]